MPIFLIFSLHYHDAECGLWNFVVNHFSLIMWLMVAAHANLPRYSAVERLIQQATIVRQSLNQEFGKVWHLLLICCGIIFSWIPYWVLISREFRRVRCTLSCVCTSWHFSCWFIFVPFPYGMFHKVNWIALDNIKE